MKRILPVHLFVFLLCLTVLSITAIGFGTHHVYVREVMFSGTSPLAASGPALFIVFLFVLPMIGFPLSVLLVPAGIIFGVITATLIVTIAIMFHLASSAWLTRTLLRPRIELILRNRGYRVPHIPREHRTLITFLFFLFPAVPYSVKNYVFAFTDVRFGFYVLIAAPINVFYAVLWIAFGDTLTTADWRSITAAITLLILVFSALALFKRFLRNRNVIPPQGS